MTPVPLIGESTEGGDFVSTTTIAPVQYSDFKSICIDVLEQDTGKVAELLPTITSTQELDPLSPLCSLIGNALTGSALEKEVGLRTISMKHHLDKLGDAGPRSIAEVRRENVKKKEAEREETKGGKEEAQTTKVQCSYPDLIFSPSEDAQMLAAHEHSQNSACVLMLWSVRGQAGKKRFGMHWVPHVPMIKPLSLSVKHTPSVKLEKGLRSIVVPITLKLRNTSSSSAFRSLCRDPGPQLSSRTHLFKSRRALARKD